MAIYARKKGADKWTCVAGGGSGVQRDYQAGDGVIINNNIISVAVPLKPMTQAEYDALPEADKMKDALYIVIDGGEGSGEEEGPSPEGGPEWKLASLPEAADWKAMAYGNGRFVAVAEGGTAAWSADGETWSTSSLPEVTASNMVFDGWRSVVYGGGRFVALITRGSQWGAWSEDGEEWHLITLPSFDSWDAAAYGGGRFVALGSQKRRAVWSADGETWTECGDAETLNGVWDAVAYGNGRFVAAAYTSSADGTDAVVWSADGEAWTRAALPEKSGWGMIASNGQGFVALSKLDQAGPLLAADKAAWSPDGEAWTSMTMPYVSNWQNICGGSGGYMAAGNDSEGTKTAYSPDGKTWLTRAMPENGLWGAMAYGGGRFAAVRNGTDHAAYCEIAEE